MKTFLNLSLKSLMIFFMLALFSEYIVSGQDVIVKKSGEEIKAKVEEVLSYEIKYRKFENLTGPVYSMPKSEISMIKYENGSSDVFNPVSVPQNRQPDVAPKPQVTNKEINHAKTGRILDYSSYVPILAGVVVTAINTGMEERFPMRYALLANTVITGALIPISVIMGGKTRKDLDVNGNLGLRISGWSIFGVTMATSIATGILTEEFDDPYIFYFPIYILDALSTTLFLLDNNKTVKQAKSLQNNVTLQPTIRIINDNLGQKYTTIGIRINF